MTTVKLRQGVRSYTTRINGVFINASQDNKIVEVEDSTADYLVSTGYFERVSPPENDNDTEINVDYGNDGVEGKYPGAPETVDLEKMKKDDLVAYAKKENVDITGLTTKAEIKQAILDAINGGVSEIFTE